MESREGAADSRDQPPCRRRNSLLRPRIGRTNSVNRLGSRQGAETKLDNEIDDSGYCGRKIVAIFSMADLDLPLSPKALAAQKSHAESNRSQPPFPSRSGPSRCSLAIFPNATLLSRRHAAGKRGKASPFVVSRRLLLAITLQSGRTFNQCKLGEFLRSKSNPAARISRAPGSRPGIHDCVSPGASSNDEPTNP